MNDAGRIEFIYGVNPVYLALTRNSGRRKIYRLILRRGRKVTQAVAEIKNICLKKSIEILELEKKDFETALQDRIDLRDFEANQGLALEVSPYNYYDLEAFLKRNNREENFLIMLDGVTDVGNFGSIIRNCSAFGAGGLIIPKNRSVQVSGRVDKVSAGASEGVKIFRVTNLARSIKKLKKAGFWVYGSVAGKDGALDLEKTPINLPMLIIMGGEQKGISRLVAENCDFLVNIPMAGGMESLNVSVASGIIMYRIYREIING